MNTFGYILLLIAVMLITLVRKENMERMRKIIDPLFGVGLLFVGIGNFISGEMIGRTTRDMLFASQSRRELWTLEGEPLQFVAVNVFFLLAGAGLILWRYVQKKNQS